VKQQPADKHSEEERICFYFFSELEFQKKENNIVHALAISDDRISSLVANEYVLHRLLHVISPHLEFSSQYILEKQEKKDKNLF